MEPGAGADAGVQIVDPALALDLLEHAVAVAAVDPEAELGGGAAHDLVGRVAGQSGEGGIDHGVPAARQLRQRDAVGAHREQVREHGLGAAHRGLGGVAGRDVEQDRQRGRAAFGFHTHAGGLHEEGPAVGGAGLEIAHRQAFAHCIGLDLLQARGDALLGLAGLEEIDQAQPVHALGTGEAEQSGRRRVGVVDDAVTVQVEGRRRALEELAVAGLAGHRSALGTELVGDVAGHPAIALEGTGGAETRLAADGVDAVAAGGVLAAHQEARERPARLEIGPVLVEMRLADADARHLPWPEADLRLQPAGIARPARVGDVAETKVAVELPVPVGGQAEQLLRMALALVGHAHEAGQHAGREGARSQPAADDQALQQHHEEQRVGSGARDRPAARLGPAQAGEHRQRETGERNAGPHAGHCRDHADHDRGQAEGGVAHAVTQGQGEQGAQQHGAGGAGIEHGPDREGRPRAAPAGGGGGGGIGEQQGRQAVAAGSQCVAGGEDDDEGGGQRGQAGGEEGAARDHAAGRPRAGDVAGENRLSRHVGAAGSWRA